MPPMEIQIIFKPEQLIAARKSVRDEWDAPISQRRFAKRLGVSEGMYHLWEKGRLPASYRLFELVYKLQQITGREYRADDFVEIRPVKQEAQAEAA